MKKRNGFTLVEIVIVIALLGLMMLLVVPNVVNRFANAKRNMFYNDVLNLYSNAASEYISRAADDPSTPNYFCKGDSACGELSSNPMGVDAADDLQYYIEVDTSGHIIVIYVVNNDFLYSDHVSETLLTIEKKDIDKNKIAPRPTGGAAAIYVPVDDDQLN